MDTYLGSVYDLCHKEEVPFIIAGDLFHRHNSPPELINFVMKRLPKVTWAIPGQHDLPLHNYEDIKKSAYWTLVEAGVVKNLEPNKPYTIRKGDAYVEAFAFPFGHEPKPSTSACIHSIAIIHHYVWIQGSEFPSAPQDSHVQVMLNKLKGFDVAFFGDNHKPFYHNGSLPGHPRLVNCGTFLRRNSDEQNVKTGVWLLRDDVTVKRHLFNINQFDQFVDKAAETELPTLNTKSFIKALKDMDVDDLDFKEYLIRLIASGQYKLTKAVRKIIISLLEDV